MKQTARKCLGISTYLILILAVHAASFYPSTSTAQEDAPTSVVLQHNTWDQLVLPGNPGSQTIGSFFGGALAADDYAKTWIVFTYDGVGKTYENPGINGTLNQAQAFWIIQITGVDVELVFSSDFTDASVLQSLNCNSSAGCAQVALATSTGEVAWTMIGAPYKESVLIAETSIATDTADSSCIAGCTLDEAAAASYIGNELWRYDSASNAYIDMKGRTSFEPLQGFWLATTSAANGTNPEVLFPSPPNGSLLVTVPSVLGLAQADSEAAITTAELTVGIITKSTSSSIPTGNVISQDPAANTEVEKGTAVNLVVSSGSLPVAVTVPNVVGANQTDVKPIIEAVGLILGTVATSKSNSVPVGEVISQIPIAGKEVSRGTSINLVISASPPSINDFTPTTVSIGESLVINGNNLIVPFGRPPVVTFNDKNGGTVNAPIANFTNNRIEVTVPGSAVSGPITVNVGTQATPSNDELTIVAFSDFKLSVAPSDLKVIRGKSTSIVVEISSQNNFAQVANLAVVGLPSGLSATFNPKQIAVGQTSALIIETPANHPIGAESITVSASATVDDIDLSQSSNVNIAIEEVTTSFIGRTVVADPEQTPLAGVTIEILGLDGEGVATNCFGETTSDSAGNFAIDNLGAGCVGDQLIRYDGTTVTSPEGVYAGVDLIYSIAKDEVTESPVLVHLPRIDNSETVMVIQNHTLDQSFRFATIPNLSTTIYAGTILTLKDGSQPDPFPLTAIEVPIDRLPEEMPIDDRLGPFIVAFQPANAEASQPVAVTFPNLINTPPATNLTLMTLDPTLGRMVAYGTGTVSDNGLKVIPDLDPANPGKRFGLVHFDWHGPTGPQPNQNDPCPNGPCGGDPVHLASGLVIDQRTDIAIPAPGGGVSIQRTYRTQSANAGPFGIGGNHNYSYFLNLSNPSPTSAVINLVLPAGNQFPMANNGGGIFTNAAEPTLRGVALKVNQDGTADLTFNDGTVFHFVPGGFRLGSVLQTITDLNGNTTTLVRNQSNPIQISEIIDSVGRKLKLSYDNGNRITQVIDPIGRTVKYTYTNFGRLETATDPEGGVTRYTYVRPTPSTESNLLETITDARGVVVARNFYGSVYGPACGRATGLSDDDLAVMPSAQRDACLNDPQTVRDERIWKQIAADGGAMNFRYTLSNEILPLSPVIQTDVTDALDNTTTYRFSTQGQLLDVTDPVGQSMVFDREPGGNQLMGKRGNATCAICGDISSGDNDQTRDENGNVLSNTDPFGNVSTLSYESRFNRPSTITDALGNTTRFNYDDSGNLRSTIDPSGNSTRFSYNSRGLPVEISDALGNKTAMHYDSFGNLVRTTDALGNISQFVYDGVGRLLEATDILGRKNKLTYDHLDRVISQTDAKGSTTNFLYDSVGNPLSVTDVRNNSVAYSYDVMSRVATRLDAAGESGSFLYDLSGNLTQITDRRGEVHRFSYDRLNRVITEQYADSSTVEYAYDARGRLVHVADSLGGIQTFQYDALGRLIREAAANGTLNYSYDKVGRVKSHQALGEPTVTYSYDARGNLLSASDSKASVTFTYNALNHRTALMRANGVDTIQTYDSLNRVVSIAHSNTDGVIGQLSYTYDRAGNRQSLDNTLGQSLISKSADASFDDANRMTKRDSYSYTYDKNGNRTSKTTPKGSTNYAWDSRNRLKSIEEPNGIATSFRYDAFNNLILQQVEGPAGGINTKFLVDQLTNVIRQSNSNGDDLSLLTGRTIDEHFTITRSNGTQNYIAGDAINSTVVTTDSTGLPVRTYSYEPYGQSSTLATETPIQFTGRMPVSDGLYYYRARFYDPIAGRFLSEDPLGVAAGINLYEYASGSPVQLTDATGECPWCIAMGVGALSGFAFDLGLQWLENGGNFNCVDWGRAGTSAVIGAGLSGLGSTGFLLGRSGTRAFQYGYNQSIPRAITINRGSTRFGWSRLKGRDVLRLRVGSRHYAPVPGISLPSGASLARPIYEGGAAGAVGALGNRAVAGSSPCGCR